MTKTPSLPASSITDDIELLREIMVVVTIEAAAWKDEVHSGEMPQPITSGNLVELLGKARKRAAAGHADTRQFLEMMDAAVAKQPGHWGSDDAAKCATALFNLSGHPSIGSFLPERRNTLPRSTPSADNLG